MALFVILSLGPLLVAAVALCLAGWLHHQAATVRDLDGERLASVELHRIGTRLNVARARAEIHRDSLTFKDWLREELNDYRP
jgi:hypothetical protein